MSPDANLIARMDANLAAYWGAYGLAKGSHLEEFPGAVFIHTPIPLSLFNSVILTGQDPGSIEAAVGRVAKHVAESGRPVLWRMSPMASSIEVRELLVQRGLKPQGGQPAMLADLSERQLSPQIDGLRIKAVEGRSGRYDWAWLTCDAFELGSDVRKAMSACEAAIPEGEFTRQPRYVGSLDGEPVAVGSLVMAADLAGVYAIATLPKVRKRGVGAAMTRYAMEEGRLRGARSAVLQATVMGKPIYEKIGFSTAFEYEMYLQT